MITFATFMIHNVFCKINEFHAKFVVARNNLFTELRQNNTNTFKIIAEFKEFAPIVQETLLSISKAEKKLPTWVKNQCILPKTPCEQSSSELAASFRASLVSPCNILSITGGLGVDDIAFAQNGHTVISLDMDPCLNAIFDYNLQQLDISGVTRFTAESADFLENTTEKYNLIYADPDRRKNGERKTSNAAEYSPDIISLLKNHHEKAERWLIKLSPMVDADWFKQSIQLAADIYILSVNNEVKELLVDIGVHSSNKTIVVQLTEQATIMWNGNSDEAATENSGKPTFCEPKPGIIKSGHHRNISQNSAFRAENLSKTFFTCFAKANTDLFRVFEIEHYWELGVKQIADKLATLGIVKANITCRDYALTPDELRKKLKLSDGGEHYLFFTTEKGKKKSWLCKKSL